MTDPIQNARRRARADFAISRPTVRAGVKRATRSTYAALRADVRAVLESVGIEAPKAPRVFGSSVKVEKGEASGIATIVAYLTPGGTCPNATRECIAACLGLRAGMLALSPARRAQRWKTALLRADPVLFVAMLSAEIQAHIASSARSGKVPAVRVDGSSDTGIGQLLAEYHPDARFYDYTKSRARALLSAVEQRANYVACFSYSGQNARASRDVLRAGGSVAVVFAVMPESKARGRASALPVGERFEGAPILDGDRHDARFLDDHDAGAVVALSLKGSDTNFEAVADRAGSFAMRGDARSFEG